MLNVQTEKQYIKIVEKYADMIYRIAYQKVPNCYDAENIVQDVFAKMLSNKSYFQKQNTINSKLTRARNKLKRIMEVNNE